MNKPKEYIKEHEIFDREQVLELIKNNPNNLTLEELTSISEMVNNNRTATAAFYTDKKILEHISKILPDIEGDTIRILEPSVGVGNFIEIVINKYSNAKKLIIDVIDVDHDSLKILRYLNKYRKIPSNVEINLINEDYLDFKTEISYDLVIGNPPFFNMSSKNGLKHYRNKFSDEKNKNIAGFFLIKSISISINVIFILPKYILHNIEYSNIRKLLSSMSVPDILDFGEFGFKGVLIETIAISISKDQEKSKTVIKSIPRKSFTIHKQDYIMDPSFPTWLIYRNELFDKVASKLKFDVFTVYRDRQITNRLLSNVGEIRVLKSKNLKRDGTQIINIEGYDAYTAADSVKRFKIYNYLNRDDVYLCPNMTYYPRVFKKPKNCLVNGSVAIFEVKGYTLISNKDLLYFASSEFEEFYRVARNHSTRSLNLDPNSVFYFGVQKEDN